MLFDHHLNQFIHLFNRQVQALGFCANDGGFCIADVTVFEDGKQLGFQQVTLFHQLVAEGRGQQSGRDGKDADAHQSQDAGDGPAHRCDRRDVAIAHRGQSDHRPIDGGGNVFKLLRLRVVLKQVAQAGGQHQQQHHDEGGCAHDRPFAHHHFDQHGGGVAAACELEQSRQTEYPQEAQVDQVVQEHFKEEGQDGQEVDQGGRRFGLFEAS